MHRGYRLLGSLFLTAVLVSPVALMASASPQDDRNQEHRQTENNRRYYDKGHKQYHTWDANEGQAYQRYQTQHHEKRGFDQLKSNQQTTYWKWRHNNPDR